MTKDVTKKRCLSDNGRYADLINATVFQGRQVINEDALTDLDTQAWLKIRHSGKKKYLVRQRDLIRKVAMGMNFAVIGIENQEEIHYLMPLRIMEYDAAEYGRQAEKIRKKVQRKRGITGAEFLSGFTKEERLRPCITIVLYYGDNWDGSRDLHGLLDFSDIPKELQGLVNNYRIYLVEVKKFENTDLFKTDLKQIFDFIRVSENRSEVKALVQKDTAYQELEEDAYDMIAEYTDSEELLGMKKYRRKDGKVNMCEGLRGIMEESLNEGMELGRIAGMEAGLKAGEEKFMKLTKKLVKRNRIADLERAIEDAEYREKLYKKLRIR